MQTINFPKENFEKEKFSQNESFINAKITPISQSLENFALEKSNYAKFSKPKLHLFVCTNDRTGIPSNLKPSCGPRITPEHAKELKLWIREQGLTNEVYCTQAKCLGFCNAEGSVAVIYPKGRFVNGIQNLNDLKMLIKEELSTL